MTDIAEVDDVQAHIAETIKGHPIVLFMKGSPSHPQCGFSAAVVQVLAHYGVPVHAVDVLANPSVRQGIKTFSDWPTIPHSTSTVPWSVAATSCSRCMRAASLWTCVVTIAHRG
jgi:Grx4 family monothiol glutaredoxin